MTLALMFLLSLLFLKWPNVNTMTYTAINCVVTYLFTYLLSIGKNELNTQCWYKPPVREWEFNCHSHTLIAVNYTHSVIPFLGFHVETTLVH